MLWMGECVQMHYHTVSFTNQTRVERNNTEAFIKKCCDAAVQKFVMREVRTQSKAEKGRMQREKAAMKKKTKAARLAATALEFDINKIEDMSSVRLKDQLAVYRDVLKDEILSKMLWKNMTTVAVRRNLVLEARTRELARRDLEPSLTPTDPPTTTQDMVVDEYGFSEQDDADWVDVD
ncbi:hypothetical protein B0H11DRAFT_2217989 [Mycena galericulata]|nr:hypothetical protein B0H11DRAFT_2217989 [Mycena galericulata]